MEMLNIDIYARVITYLNQTDLREARLVCREWNTLILPKLMLNASKFAMSGQAHMTDTNCASTDTRLWFRIGFPILHGSVKERFDISCQSFLDKFNFYHRLRHASLYSSAQVVQLGKASSQGFLPNLQDLLFNYITVPDPEHTINATLPQPECLSQLKSFSMFNIYNMELGSEHQFWQSVINAAPNILLLRAIAPFELERLTKLKEIVLWGDGFKSNCMPQVGEMLQAVSPAIKKLAISLRTNGASNFFPFMKNLSSLEYTTFTDDTGLFSNILAQLCKQSPNLKRLKAYFGCNRNDPSEAVGGERSQVLNLQYLEIQKSVRRGEQDLTAWWNGWATSVSKVGTLCVVVPDPERDDLAMEDWIDLVLSSTVETDRLILKLARRISFSMMLRYLHMAEFDIWDDGRSRGILEIRNSERWGQMFPERQKYYKKFFVLMQKLLRKWRKVEIKKFQITEPFLSDVLEDVRKLNYNVEVS